MRLRKPETQREQGMTAAAVVAGLLGVLYYMYVYTPKAEALALVEAHVAALDSTNQIAKAEMAKGTVDELRKRAARQSANLELMRQLVPTSNEVPALLEQVSTAARRVNLDVSAVQPEPVIAGDDFDTHRYRISVVGGYHAIGEFLSNVGSLTRIVVPMGVRLYIRSGDDEQRRTPDGEAVVKTEFEIQTYVARQGSASASEVRGGEIERGSNR
jgi:type IV pilus assembly protein PilO